MYLYTQCMLDILCTCTNQCIPQLSCLCWTFYLPVQLNFYVGPLHTCTTQCMFTLYLPIQCIYNSMYVGSLFTCTTNICWTFYLPVHLNVCCIFIYLYNSMNVELLFPVQLNVCWTFYVPVQLNFYVGPFIYLYN